MTEDARIDAEILVQLERRGPDKSICPSEVARALAPEWRGLMSHVRRRAACLAQAGLIEILRHGKPVPPGALRGVIRLRLKP